MSVKGDSSSSGPTVGALHKDIKMNAPEPYGGERSKLKGFLVQLDLYLAFHSSRFSSDTERVLFVVTLLKGEALNWIEGFVVDYMKYKSASGSVTKTMQRGTQEIFLSYAGFVRRIRATFGEVDEVRQAERAIQMLRQRGSAATYTAEFQRQAIKTGWDDRALKAQYYRGLKDAVKDELVKQERPDNMEELVEQAVNIDNRLYERALEKRGFYDTNHKRRDHRPARYTEPMELDATDRRELPQQKKQEYMEKKLCFNCGKPGHMARNCRSGRNNRNNPKKGVRFGELNVATRGRGIRRNPR